MADDLNTMLRQRVAYDDVALRAQPDPRVLLASIVHDFNALLPPIVSVLEEMQGRGTGTARQLKKIDGALYCAFRAKTLARQLVDFASSRLVKLVAVDVGRLLERLEAPLASLLSMNIRLDVDIADDLPKAFIDQQLIERALLNLVLNARDAMPAGGRLTMAAAPDYRSGSRGGGPMIRLTIADSGVGMDEATLKMAGEPHFSTKTNGTGLGLVAGHGMPGRRPVDRQRASSRHHSRFVAAHNVTSLRRVVLSGYQCKGDAQ